jgi:hypothetical protein
LAAQRNYLLTPVNISIELFRAKKKTFYMDDFKYLGWIPIALKGVMYMISPANITPSLPRQTISNLQKCCRSVWISIKEIEIYPNKKATVYKPWIFCL